MSEGTAAATGIEIGDRLQAQRRPGRIRCCGTSSRGRPTPIEIEVVGLFAVRDPAAPFWFDDGSLDEIAIGGTDDNPIAFATRSVRARPPTRPPRPRPAGALPMARVRRRRIASTPARLDVLAADLRRRRSRVHHHRRRATGATLVRSGLLGIVERYLDQRATSEAALSVAALGPLTVAAGAVGLIGFLDRPPPPARRSPLPGVGAHRPASCSRRSCGRGCCVTVPAAVLGLWRGRWCWSPPGPSVLSPIGAILVALAATALLHRLDLAGRPSRPARARARRPAGVPALPAPARVRDPDRRSVARRRVAAARARARRRRVGRRDAASIRSWPPRRCSSASPSACSRSASIRCRSRALGWLMARRRDLVPGARAAQSRPPSHDRLPAAPDPDADRRDRHVLVRAAGEHRAEPGRRSPGRTSAPTTGSTARSAGALPTELDARGVGGVEAAAEPGSFPMRPCRPGPGGGSRCSSRRSIAAAYEAVLAGSPVAPDFPSTFATPPTQPGTGTPADPIPAAVSTRLPNGSRSDHGSATSFELTLGRPDLHVPRRRVPRRPSRASG